MFFKDKVVWITGASAGIGEALAYAFNSENAKIIISARRENELIRVKENCKNKETEIFILPIDLEDHKSLEEKAGFVLNKFGRIDIVIHNGGVSQRSFVNETSFDIDKKIMDINYFGAIAITKAVLPQMIIQKSGHFVVISSLMGKFGNFYRSAYAASKHALHGFFETLRLENCENNINITMVCPGFIKTNVSLNALTGNGNAFNKMDDGMNNGMEPEVLAAKILKSIKNNKFELVIGGKEILAVYIKRFFPRMLHKILLKNKK